MKKNRLVYFELFEDMYTASSREKQIKAGSRKAKINLIERRNPGWSLVPDATATLHPRKSSWAGSAGVVVCRFG